LPGEQAFVADFNRHLKKVRGDVATGFEAKRQEWIDNKMAEKGDGPCGFKSLCEDV
jgi:hypothetical protein